MNNTTTALGGAAAVGMAVAVWWTHGGAWEPVEVGTLGAGIGATIKYVVGWIDLFKPKGDA
jgi:hypothetical protein